MRATPTQSAL
ncbi:unnamed protein product, partial [Tilletia caries]